MQILVMNFKIWIQKAAFRQLVRKSRRSSIVMAPGISRNLCVFFIKRIVWKDSKITAKYVEEQRVGNITYRDFLMCTGNHFSTLIENVFGVITRSNSDF